MMVTRLVTTSARKAHAPLPEFLEWDAVWKTLSANADALQDPITSELIQNQVGGQLSRLSPQGQKRI